MDCIFCKIIAGDIPCHKLYETDDVLAFLDIGPVSEGHTLVIPKVHVTDLGDGSREIAMQLMGVVHDIAPRIMTALGATGYNLGMNHGVDARQDVLHTHLHIMPRKHDVARAFVKTHPTQEELAVTAEKIRTRLTK